MLYDNAAYEDNDAWASAIGACAVCLLLPPTGSTEFKTTRLYVIILCLRLDNAAE